MPRFVAFASFVGINIPDVGDVNGLATDLQDL